MIRKFSYFYFSITALWALPQTPLIRGGNAEFLKATDQRLEILASDRTIIEWKEFSTVTGEEVHFSLPSHSSVVLNRVTGIDPSYLFGSIISNGQVVLVNPNGVLVGKSGMIDTASFIASTLDVHTRAFLDGEMLAFSGDSKASIVNYGTIRSMNGESVLVGVIIRDEGNISGNATAHLSTHQVILKPSHEEKFWIKTDVQGDLSRLGEDTHPYRFAFKHPDDPDALDAIAFLSLNGEISSPGGEIFAMGERIEIGAKGKLDVSSREGKGRILVGGDFQGKNPNFKSAKQIYLAEGSSLRADALQEGDGGQVIVWSEGLNSVWGSISSEGGPLGGKGGQIETSGKFLDFHAQIFSKGGELLLDPQDIQITGATSANVTFGGACGVNTYCVISPACAPNPSTILNTTISAQLNAGTNITITTSSGCPNNGDITIVSGFPITWNTNPAVLTLIADRDIIVQADIQESNAVATAANRVVLNATRDVIIDAVGGAATVSCGSQFAGTAVTARRDVAVNAGTGATRSAQIGFRTPDTQSSSGTINVAASRDVFVTAGNSNVGVGAQIGHGQPNSVFGAPVRTRTIGTPTITVNATRNITVTGAAPPLGLESSGKIGHGSNHMIGSTTNQSDQTGNIFVTAGGILTLQGGLFPTDSSPAVIGHGTSDIVFVPATNTTTIFNGDISVSAASIQILGGNSANPDGGNSANIGHTINEVSSNVGPNAATNVTMIGNITVNSGGIINLTAGVSAVNIVTRCNAQIGHAVLQFNFGNILASVVSFTGDISVTSNGNITLTAGSGVPLAFSTINPAWIGHGCDVLGGPATGQISGNILVRCLTGNVLLDASPPTALQSAALIGHGTALAGHITSCLGNITVQVPQGGISMLSGVAPNTSKTAIGFSSGIDNATGNINICCRDDLIMQSGTSSFNTSIIGHNLIGTSDSGVYQIAVGGNISMNSLGFECWIGGLGGDPIRTSTLELACCRNLQVTSSNTQAENVGIGFQNSVGSGSVTPVFVAVGGNFTATSNTQQVLFTSIGADYNLAVKGNADFLSSAHYIRIGADAPGITNISVGGNFTTTNAGGVVIVGRDNINSSALFLRAGGNIQLSSSIAGPPGLNPIVIQAGHTFAAGDLWTSSAGSLTSVSTAPIPGGFPLSCMNCPLLFSPSTPIVPSCGGFFVQPGTSPTISTLGDLTLNSLCVNCSPPGGPSILTLGTAPGNLNLSVGGNLLISAFDTINVNEVINTTNGDVTMNACRDINVRFTIFPLGLGNAICLASDVNFDGTGNIHLIAPNGVLLANNGPINLTAGNALGCINTNITGCGSCPSSGCQICSNSNASIIEDPGIFIISGSGNITANAAGDIDLNGTINTTTGFVHTAAGHDTNLSGIIKVTMGGEVRMTNGHDMNMLAGSLIDAALSSVTLVCDSCFPAAPLIGPGAFNMDASSSIIALQVQIFTARQSQNTILGTFTGPLGLCPPFAAGTLYTNTSQEIWCTYFNCPANPLPTIGTPCFTIFYKNCLQQATQQATLIVDEFLTDLHPYNEFPGWMSRFLISYSSELFSKDEPYLIRRRTLNLINHPKSYTVWLNDDIVHAPDKNWIY